jgi:hypothetical protein
MADKEEILPPTHLPEAVLDKVMRVWDTLAHAQKEALVSLVSVDIMGRPGKSQIILGSAGVGKSFYIDLIRSVLAPVLGLTLVTALTGRAASNLSTEEFSAHTLHSLIAVRENVDVAVQHMSKYAADRLALLRLTKVLVVDEVGMLSAEYFEYMHYFLQKIRGNCHDPFGGMILVLVGDVKQLEPVGRKEDENGPSWRCFITEESLRERAFGPNIFEFTENKRQKDDLQWAQILERIGRGKTTEADMRTLIDRVTINPRADALHIYYTNQAVNTYNRTKLATLRTPAYQIHRIIEVVPQKKDDGSFVTKFADRFLETAAQLFCQEEKVAEVEEFKQYAPIRMLWNRSTEMGQCNGALFIFLSYEQNKRAIKVVHMKDAAYKDDATRQFLIPLRSHTIRKENVGSVTIFWASFMLCFAQTGHSMQGSQVSGPCAINASNMTQPGMVYTALSRVTKLENLDLTAFHRGCIVPSRLIDAVDLLLAEKAKIRSDARRRQAGVLQATKVVRERDAQVVKAMEIELEELIRTGAFDDDGEAFQTDSLSKANQIQPGVPEEGNADEELDISDPIPSAQPRSADTADLIAAFLWDEEHGGDELACTPQAKKARGPGDEPSGEQLVAEPLG